MPNIDNDKNSLFKGGIRENLKLCAITWWIAIYSRAGYQTAIILRQPTNKISITDTDRIVKTTGSSKSDFHGAPKIISLLCPEKPGPLGLQLRFSPRRRIVPLRAGGQPVGLTGRRVESTARREGRAYASESQVRVFRLCLYKSTGVMEYWSGDVMEKTPFFIALRKHIPKKIWKFKALFF